MEKKRKIMLGVLLVIVLIGLLWTLALTVDACGGCKMDHGKSSMDHGKSSHDSHAAGSVWGQSQMTGVIRANHLADIMKNPDNFLDKTVSIQGTVKDECPSGGSFYLEDQISRIFVDLHSSSFTIPQISNRQVQVSGNVVMKDNKLIIIGKRVELLKNS